MPPFRIPEEHLWQIVAYVHSLTRPGVGPPVSGDPEVGHRVFQESGCYQCHQVGGKGGAVGPELSSIGLRSSSEKIRESVLTPQAQVAEGYRVVSVTTAAGETITGTLKNEDNFSMQIMTLDGGFALLDRSEVKRSSAEHRSLMPDNYGRKLSPEDLQNLLAFLDRQRAPFVKLVSTFQNY
jgi:putative heme-binding domain-containing protein